MRNMRYAFNHVSPFWWRHGKSQWKLLIQEVLWLLSRETVSSCLHSRNVSYISDIFSFIYLFLSFLTSFHLLLLEAQKVFKKASTSCFPAPGYLSWSQALQTSLKSSWAGLDLSKTCIDNSPFVNMLKLTDRPQSSMPSNDNPKVGFLWITKELHYYLVLHHHCFDEC